MSKEIPEVSISPEISISTNGPSTAVDALESKEANPVSHLLDVQAREFEIAQGQQELLSVEEIKDRIKLLDHQLQAAHRALFKMGGGALFADEVGLKGPSRSGWFSRKWTSVIPETVSVDHIDSRVISSDAGESDRTGREASSKRW
jgi:hypothetical protein